MACAHPIKLDYYKLTSSSPYNHFTNYFPCGRCLNCRVDKQNDLTARCEWEYIQKKCGAFVTFTYDDPHLQKHFRHDSSGQLVATLSRRDCKKFLDRLNKLVHKQKSNILCNHNYKYLAVGEYGQNGQMFDRPHFHILFFGLDFAYCKKLFERAWQAQGKIDSLPILNGGIRYVLKYLDKQLYGDLAKMKYDQNNLERPFQTHSLCLGSGLFQSQLKYIKSHNNCYRWKGRDVPVNNYIKNKYLLPRNYRLENQVESMQNINLAYGVNITNLYDLKQFSIQKARIRESNLNKMNERSGKPRFDFLDFMDSDFRDSYITKGLANKALSYYQKNYNNNRVFIKNEFG